VDVAEDSNNSRAAKVYGPVRARRIKAYIENLAAKVRKGAVENGIEIRKVDGSTYRDGEYVRLETFVLLNHANARGSDRLRDYIDRREPDHHTRKVVMLPHRSILGTN